MRLRIGSNNHRKFEDKKKEDMHSELIFSSESSDIHSNSVITISVYERPGLSRQIFCGTSQFLTVNHNITVLCGNNTLL
jgi:hypothetical protein